MKKVRIELKPGATPRSFYLFPSVEALFEWGSTSAPAPVEGLDTVELQDGEFFEAEWMGCEYAYDGPVHKKYDYVRLARTHEPKNASGTLVTMHYGWVEENWIPFRNVEWNEVKATTLLTEAECKLAMPPMLPEDDEHDVDVAELTPDDDDDDEEK